MLARYMLWLCVCPADTSRGSIKTAKHNMIAQGLYFSEAKDFGEIQWR